MADDPRVTVLLEELLGSGLTPEEVCRDCPELLPRVRERWQQFGWIDAQVRALFPEPGATATAGLPQVPGYEIEAVLGHGGVGVVYKALHLRLQRPVALKMLLAGSQALPQELERFRREAAAVASLRHPNVVQIFDVGDVAGRPYFTMEFVEGGSLAQKIHGVPQPARDAAALVATLAEAVHAAHQGGVVHRDLKPANILLQMVNAECGTQKEKPGPAFCALNSDFFIPKITDFGLARRLQDAAGLTLSGAPLGTPSYMAPEQAEGRKGVLGPATDVYALGAVLYELLTGRPPFRAETAAATVQQVLTHDPVTPSRLNPRVPRDLETICLKCLHKEPPRRYARAADLADDLGRFLRHEPIRARPVGLPGRLARWARRHPGPAGLTTALVSTALVAFALILWQWRVAEDARGRADRMATRLVLDRGIALCERGDIGPGLLWLARGLGQAERGADTDLMPAFRANLTAWSERLVVPHVGPTLGASVMTVAFHPDGMRLLVARWHDAFGNPGPGEARLVDAFTLESLGPPLVHPRGVRTAALSPDGTRVLTGDAEGFVRLWDTESGRPLGHPLKLGAVIMGAAFAPNGESFATGTYLSSTTCEVQIWDALTRQPITPALPYHGRLYCLAFSPDGRTLMTGGGVGKTTVHPDSGEVRFWDSRTGLPAGPVLVHATPVRAAAFSPDGQILATGSADGLVARWRHATWEEIRPPLHHPSPIDALVFSRDGRSLLTGTGIESRPLEAALRLWDSDSGKLLASPWSHPASVMSIAWHPDGRHFATGCWNGQVRVFRLGAFQPERWRYLDGIQATELFSHDGNIPLADGRIAVCFNPEGRRLVAGGATPDGRQAARLVDVLTGSVCDLLPDRKSLLAEAVRAAGLSASLSGGEGWSALVSLPGLRTRASIIEGAAFAPQGKIAVTTGEDGRVRLWDAESASLIQGPRSYGAKTIPWMMLMPDEHTLVTGARGRPIEVWDRDSGQRVAGPITGDAVVQAMTLGPDGRTLATAGDGGIVQLWDVHTGQLRTRWDAVGKTIWALRFSPDGRTLLAGGGGTAWLFDARTGKQRCQPLSHPEIVWEARFSPDGKRLLTVCSDEYRDLHAGAVQLWDAFSGKPLGPPLAHRVAGLAAAFDPEGRLVATGGFDGDVRLWDAATGAPVGPALVQTGPIPAVAFVAGTKLLAAAGRDGHLSLWPVPEAKEGSPAQVRHWVETLTGKELDETDAVRDLR